MRVLEVAQGLDCTDGRWGVVVPCDLRRRSLVCGVSDSEPDSEKRLSEWKRRAEGNALSESMKIEDIICKQLRF